MVALLLVSGDLLAWPVPSADRTEGGIQFRPQASKVLAILADFVGLTRCALSRPFLVIEASTMLLLEALDILVLRHGAWLMLLECLGKAFRACGESEVRVKSWRATRASWVAG